MVQPYSHQPVAARVPEDLVCDLVRDERVDVRRRLSGEPVGEIERRVVSAERVHVTRLDERERISLRIVARGLRGAKERVRDNGTPGGAGRWIVGAIRCGRARRRENDQGEDEEATGHTSIVESRD